MELDRKASGFKPGVIRNRAIDHFRGLAVLLMVCANFLGNASAVPSWLKHAPDVGITLPDFIAPFFVFAIALTFGASVRRRMLRDGWTAALGHTVYRSMALIGIGTLFTIGETSYGFNPGGVMWGVLQALGTASLLTFFTLRLHWAAKVVLAAAVLGGYQWMLDHYWLAQVLHSSHAGIQGSLSWTAMMILGCALADLYHEKETPSAAYWLVTALLLAAGICLSLCGVEISKHRMSASFVAIAASASAVVFAACHALFNRLRLVAGPLLIWGRNSLLMYITHCLLLAVFVVPAARWWYVDAPGWQLALELAIFASAVFAAGYLLNRKRIFASL